jgi:GNAT superfamily N-acetyltransferase
MNDAQALDEGGCTLRKATMADLETIMGHRRSMFLDMGHQDEHAIATMLASAREFIAERFATGRFHGWVIENSERQIIAGGGLLVADYLPSTTDPLPRRAIIVNMYTEPAYRRRGFARRLMLTMITWCRSEGFGTILLHASTDGRPLYQQLGFNPTNEMRLMLK